jgi:hypothetical protein
LPSSLRQALALTFLAFAAVVGCDSGGTECECPSVGLTVNLPAPLAGELTAIEPSGLACTGARVIPARGADVAPTQFQIEPTTTGPCHLDILFTDGTVFSDDVTVIQTTGCCAGLRTEPPGAAEIDVPPPLDGAIDD